MARTIAEEMIRDARHKYRVNDLFTLLLLHHESLCFRPLLRLFAEHFRRIPFVAQMSWLCVSCAYVPALRPRWFAAGVPNVSVDRRPRTA